MGLRQPQCVNPLVWANARRPAFIRSHPTPKPDLRARDPYGASGLPLKTDELDKRGDTCFTMVCQDIELRFIPYYLARATHDDIRACYRLLLGREPDEAGFRSWADLVFKRRISPLALAQHFLGTREYRAEYGPRLEPGRLVNAQSGGCVFTWRDERIARRALVEQGEHTSALLKVLIASLNPGDTFVDVGSRNGYFSVFAAKAVGPTGTVIAIDARPENCRLCLRNCAQNYVGNVQIFPVAVSDKIETLAYDPTPGAVRADLSAPGFDTPADLNPILALPLDMLLGALLRLDTIKIDLAGFEDRCIRGAEQTIRRFHPRILCRYSPVLLQQHSKAGGPCHLERLFAAGYDCSVIRTEGTLMNAGKDSARVQEYWRELTHGDPETHVHLLLEAR